MKDIITKKDSSSSLMSFTGQTTKTELIKSYNILRYKFLRHILSYSSFPLTDIYEMKPVKARKYHEPAKPRKKNTLKVYNILR